MFAYAFDKTSPLYLCHQDYPFFGREFDMISVGAANVDSDASLDLLVG